MKRKHVMPFGAECREDGSVRFRLWAPKAERVEVRLGQEIPQSLLMSRQDGGWFEFIAPAIPPGALYQYRINEGLRVPDPASRFQPRDVHGPSEIIDPLEFDWTDGNWHGRPWEEAVIYELHVGAFSAQGTFAGVADKLDYLADLGVTALELMPLSDFPGERNWGYDGVLPFAPDSSYGRPDDLKRLIQSAHAKGLMVFLDVVYNHFGPEGNYLSSYSPQFFTNRRHTPWGDAINFDGPGSGTVRSFFIHNALYWLEEYHFDGLRFDAVHTIMDDSNPDILTELAEEVRARVGTGRYVHLILENADNEAHYLRRGKDAARGSFYNAQWNDDIHHALHVLLTGETDGYYGDYANEPIRQLGRCLAEGFAFQGDYSEFHKTNRGEPSADLPLQSFVNFLQNHDQVGNRAFGERIVQLAGDDAIKAAMSILLLAPSPPLLFMGEEFGARTPFLFFCDFSGDLARAVTNGRRGEFGAFEKFRSQETMGQIPDPNAKETFARSKLDWQSASQKASRGWLNFCHDLLLVRRNILLPHLRNTSGNSGKFTVLGNAAIIVNWKLRAQSTLSLMANLSKETGGSVPAPLGDLIYTNMATGAGPSIDLSPWQVAWFLKK
ncbi:MAG: malto-oligosyltrehalose trehalohydrolase [Terriglobales bacterium]